MLSILRNKSSGRIYRNMGVIQVFNEVTPGDEDVHGKILSCKDDWQKEYVHLRDEHGNNVIDKPFIEAGKPCGAK